MFSLNTSRTILDRIKDLFVQDIPYDLRSIDGDWSKYFGSFDNQIWGKWDSKSCWALSAINCLEDQLEFLWSNNYFSEESKTFFKENGYIDEDGDFSISERFIEIISGVKDKGCSQKKAWDLMFKYGILPRSKLSYSDERALKFSNNEDFVKDYFNESEITDDMLNIAEQSKKFIDIKSKWINFGSKMPSIDTLRKALRQAPLQFGLAVPKHIFLWGRTGIIEWDGGTVANHAVECYHIDDNGVFEIFDQYTPNKKLLSKDYYIPYISQGIVFVK